jgi:uncharacterized lipoprotein YmbA
MIRHRPLLTGLLLSLILTGCASVTHFQYYTLKPVVTETSVADEAPAADEKTAYSIGVAPVTIPGWMDRSNLVINDGGFELIRFDTHRWGESLPDGITRTLTQDLSLLFTHSDVIAGPWLRSEAPEVAVSVDIHNLAWSDDTLTLNASWSFNQDRKRSRMMKELLTQPLAKGSSPDKIAEGFSYLLADLAHRIKQKLGEESFFRE